MQAKPSLDVITIGRASVDLYGMQVGGRLEDMSSFAKYVGGCPANIAIGTARLGLQSALLTRVGDEHMGRFIREQLSREKVDTSGVITDPERLTALVLLGIRDRESFPLIFYRENCADMALCEADIDPDFIASARAIVVTGTHFSTPSVARASRKAMDIARQAGRQVIFDIDYRPNLWGVAGHGAGEERFIASQPVTRHLQTILHACDVIVGTEEEFHIAGGTSQTLAAIKKVRDLSSALLVLKRGPMGCTLFSGDIPNSLDEGLNGPGFPVEVYNVLGAGDAFMSGFLRGYLRGESHGDAARYANAAGAFAVSRHGCAPAIPSWEELRYFLSHGSPHTALRKDKKLTHLHWTTTRGQSWEKDLSILAFDHRSQFEDIARDHNAGAEDISAFKGLLLTAVEKSASNGLDKGVIIDAKFGSDALYRASGNENLWIARPIEEPGSIPLRFEDGHDAGTLLAEWPRRHTVKCLVFYHPADDLALREDQEEKLLSLQEAARASQHELLIEVIASKSDTIGDETVASILDRFYTLGLYPDWWKLEPPANAAQWKAIAHILDHYDAKCRGVLLLGLDAPEEKLLAAFQVAAGQPWCRGFAIGRTIFAKTAKAWFSRQIDDETAITEVQNAYHRLCQHWEKHRL